MPTVQLPKNDLSPIQIRPANDIDDLEPNQSADFIFASPINNTLTVSFTIHPDMILELVSNSGLVETNSQHQLLRTFRISGPGTEARTEELAPTKRASHGEPKANVMRTCADGSSPKGERIVIGKVFNPSQTNGNLPLTLRTVVGRTTSGVSGKEVYVAAV